MALRLVAIGDSTVEGVEDPGPDGVYIGWADRFAAHLDVIHPGLLYANLAVRGHTACEVRERQLRPALALAPDFAVVVAGVNDVLRPKLDRDALREDLCAVHAELAATGARVLTFTMPDMARVAPLAVVLRRRLQFLNSVTLECGERYGSIVVDLASVPAASHPASWHTDRLHANSEGHRRIAAALAEAVGYDVEDWRAEPPPAPKPTRVRVAVVEALGRLASAPLGLGTCARAVFGGRPHLQAAEPFARDLTDSHICGGVPWRRPSPGCSGSSVLGRAASTPGPGEFGQPPLERPGRSGLP